MNSWSPPLSQRRKNFQSPTIISNEDTLSDESFLFVKSSERYGILKNMNTCVIKTPIGNVRIVEDADAIVQIISTEEDCIEPQTQLLKSCVIQLQEYFRKERTTFSFPIRFSGTPFQEKVWNALMKVPYGHVVSYGELAEMIGNPKSARAVGGAVHVNALLLVVPCHRVIANHRKIGGFALGIQKKQILLETEGIIL